MQKFNSGDHVMIAKDLGRSMSHFTSDCEAIVIGSYADKFGGNDRESYTLHVKGNGQSSWYMGNQLTIIRRGAHDLLAQWESEEKAFIDQQSDIDWIFDNGVSVAENPSGATCAALFACLTDASMWGANGEGYTWHQNAIQIMRLAAPFLVMGKKEEWLEACAKYRKANP